MLYKYKRYRTWGLLLFILIFLNMLLVFSTAYAQPTVKIAVDPDIRAIYIGKGPTEITLTAQANKQDVEFIWKIDGAGRLEGDVESPGILYIPPDTIQKESVQAEITITVTDDTGKKGSDSRLFTLYTAELFLQIGHSDQISSVKFSPDGKLIASASYDRTIKIWDVERGELLRTLRSHEAPVSSLVFADEQTIFSGSFDGTIRQWDIESGESKYGFLDHIQSKGIASLSLSSGKLPRIACGRMDGKIKLYNVHSKQPLPYSVRVRSDERIESDLSSNIINQIIFNPKRDELAGNTYELISVSNFLDRKGVIQQWKCSDSGCNPLIERDSPLIHSKTRFKLTEQSLENLEKDGVPNEILESLRHLKNQEITGIDDFLNAVKAQIGQHQTGIYDELILKHAYNDIIRSAAYSPDGQIIAIGDKQGVITLWSWNKDKAKYILKGEPLESHEGKQINTLSFSSEGRLFASGSDNHTIKIWDINTGVLLHSFNHGDRVLSVDFSPDERFLVSGGRNGTILLWNVKNGELLCEFRGHRNSIHAVVFGYNDASVAFGTENQTLHLWDWKDGKLRHNITHNVKEIAFLAPFSSQDGTLSYYDPKWKNKQWHMTENKISSSPFYEDREDISSIAFSSDGKSIAYGKKNGKIDLCPVDDQKLYCSIDTLQDAITFITFSPDGQTLASISKETNNFAKENSSILLWDVESCKLLKTVNNQNLGAIKSLAFSDKQTLVSLSGSRTITFWKVKEEQLEFEGILPTSPITISGMGVNRNGRLIAIGRKDSTVDILEVKPGEIQKSGEIKMSITLLPDNEWIAYHPEELVYTSSPRGDENVAIRFGNQLRAVYPLKYYREVLKRRGSLEKAFSQIPPEIKPKKFLLLIRNTGQKLLFLWKVNKLLTSVFVGIGTFIILVGYWVTHRGSKPIEIAKRFFTKVGFEGGRSLSKTLLLLHSKDKQLDILVTLWEKGSNAEDIIKEIKKHKEHKELQNIMKFYLIYEAQKPSDRVILLLRRELLCEIIPLLVSSLKEDSPGEKYLKELEQQYLIPPNPYSKFNMINLFFNREKFGEQVYDELKQGKHVAILGLHKIGKTWVAKEIYQKLMEDDSSIPVFINCQNFTQNANVCFKEILDELHTNLKNVESLFKLPKLPKPPQNVKKEEDFRNAFDTFFYKWKPPKHLTPFSIIFIFDHLDELFPGCDTEEQQKTLREYKRLFGTLRCFDEHHAEHRVTEKKDPTHGKRLVMLVVGCCSDVNSCEEIPHEIGKTPMYQLFQQKWLNLLNSEDSENVIHKIGKFKNIKWDDTAARRVFHYCGGHPYVTCCFAREACTDNENIRKYIKYEDVEDTAAKIQEKFPKGNDIGRCYGYIWNALPKDEQELLKYIWEGPEHKRLKKLIVKEQKRALENLENLGLITLITDINRTVLQLSAKLFVYWLNIWLNSLKE